MKISQSLFAALLSTAPALAQADNCANATDLGSGTVSIAFDTTACVDTGTFATTSAEQQCLSLTDDVWFRWTADETGTAVFSTCNASTFDTEIGVWEGASCASFVGLGCNDDAPGCDDFTSEIEVPVTAGGTYYIQIGHWNAQDGDGFGAGTLSIFTGGDPCLDNPDDGFEDNDTCPGARPIAPGVYTDLFLDATDPDYYSIILGPSERLEVVLTDADPAQFELSYSVDGCNPLGLSFSGMLAYENMSAASQEVVIGCLNPLFAVDPCRTYGLTITRSLGPGDGPCATDADFLEPNTSCLDAVPLSDGTYSGLQVEDADNDYYAVTVGDGDTLLVDLQFSNAFGDVDVYLWDPSIACDTNLVGAGGGTGALAVGFTVSDNESIAYNNVSGAAQNLIVEVDMFTAEVCNDYSLTIVGAAAGPGPIGTAFCDMGNPNSTGLVGQAVAIGSASVAANDVRLSVFNAPPGQFGIFLTSLTQTPPTPVADGFLCLGLAIGRYQHEGDVWQAAANGTAALQIDLTSIPSPTGPVAALAGESRSFQAWHRDATAAGSTANFTTGVEITFVP